MEEDLEKPPKGFFSRLKWRVSLCWRLILAILLPLALLPLVFLEDNDVVYVDGERRKSTKFRAAYTIMIVAFYWMFEVMPLAVTSLLPMVLFPFLGVLDTSEVAPTYFKETNVMFFGGLVLALAVEYCNLHRRIALRVMTIVGSGPIRLLFGVMFTSMFLSMWMSNTACTAMMLPILLAVLDQLAGANTADLIQATDTISINTNATSMMLGNNNNSIRRFSIAHPPSEKEDANQLTIHSLPPQLAAVITESRHNSVSRRPSISGPELEKKLQQEKKRWDNIRKMYMFGVAYASNIGGTATITGTGPNLVFQDVIKRIDVGQNGKYMDMTFGTWMALNVPATILNVIMTFTYLVIVFHGFPNWRTWPIISRFVKKASLTKEQMREQEEEKKKIKNAERMLMEEYKSLGPMNSHEIGVFIIFFFVVVLWVFRDPKFMKGWNNVLDKTDIGDASAAILGIALMFIVPKDLTFITGVPKKNQPYQALLDWKFVQHHLSWGVVLLLGGGFAISDGADKSGLSQWIGEQLTGLEHLPRPVFLLIVMVITAAITEVCSNVATANVILPILLSLSATINVHPLYLTVPATISCSFAFMLPVATPPNALVFSAGNLRIMDMIKTGLFLNISCVLVYFLVQISYGELLFSYSNYEYPEGGIAGATRLIHAGDL